MKRRVVAILLSLALLTAALGVTGCDGDAVRKTREAAERLVIYSDTGIKALDELKASGVANDFEGQRAAAVTTLTELRDATLVFVEKAKTFTKFDATSRADLAKLFEAVTDALQRLKEKIAFVVTKTIEYLNARGITNVRDPQAIVRRINFALDILDASAKLIHTRLAP